jgi:tRNA pseudouridine55 synthase
MNGLLLVDKPTGISSFDVIRQLKRILIEANLPLNHRGKKILPKIGHAGTLDPAASGLMLILIGSATKQAHYLVKMDKVYAAEITLGANSSTGDRDGELTPVSDKEPSQAEVEAALANYTGEITQTPSVYSAIKIDGKEAYKRARAGESVEMPSRDVTIYSNEFIAYQYPKIQLISHVSSGTYIRSLAEDIGSALGTGGYLSALTRQSVGKYELRDAVDLKNATHEFVEQNTHSIRF